MSSSFCPQPDFAHMLCIITQVQGSNFKLLLVGAANSSVLRIAPNLTSMNNPSKPPAGRFLDSPLTTSAGYTGVLPSAVAPVVVSVLWHIAAGMSCLSATVQ